MRVHIPRYEYLRGLIGLYAGQMVCVIHVPTLLTCRIPYRTYSKLPSPVQKKSLKDTICLGIGNLYEYRALKQPCYQLDRFLATSTVLERLFPR